MVLSSAQLDPKLLREIHTEEPTKFFVFFSDGQHVIQVFLDGAVQLRVSDGQKIGSFMTMPDVNACAISRDGTWFVAAHDDRATMWDTTTQNKVCEHKQDLRVYSRRRTQTPYFTALDTSPDSSRAAIGDSTGSIVLLSIPAGERLAVYSCDRHLYRDSLGFSPAGDYLAAGTASKISGGDVTTPATLHIWDVSLCDQITQNREVPFGSPDKEVAQDERPIIVDWSNDGQQIFVGSHRSLVVVDVMTKSMEHKDIPSFQTLSDDGRFFLSTATPRNHRWVHTFGIL
ncbi:hypothetical protein V8E55_001572 [Tylopilus felleus]